MFYKANIYNYEELRDYVESPEYLERVQLRDRTTTADTKGGSTAAPGEITWAQLTRDVKNTIPFTSSTTKGSSKKPL